MGGVRAWCLCCDFVQVWVVCFWAGEWGTMRVVLPLGGAEREGRERNGEGGGFCCGWVGLGGGKIVGGEGGRGG